MDIIIVIVYVILGYWAAGKTLYRNAVIVFDDGITFFFKKLVLGFLLGILLIPIAIIMSLFGK